MIGKLLFTLLIIGTALLFIRYRQDQGRSSPIREAERQAELAAERRHAWRVALALLALMVLLSGGLYYNHWQEQHRLLSVKVISSHSGSEQRYRVYQGELDGRHFRTLDGRLIHLSDSERMEVTADEEPLAAE